MQSHAAGDGAHPGSVGETAAFEAIRNDLARTLAVIVANGSSREEIRLAVGPLCARVREERMDVAELVKAVKQTFPASTAGSRLDGAERQQILDRIISMCIDEFYAAR